VLRDHLRALAGLALGVGCFVGVVTNKCLARELIAKLGWRGELLGFEG
jgi:hypothetical protein